MLLVMYRESIRHIFMQHAYHKKSTSLVPVDVIHVLQLTRSIIRTLNFRFELITKNDSLNELTLFYDDDDDDDNNNNNNINNDGDKISITPTPNPNISNENINLNQKNTSHDWKLLFVYFYEVNITN